MNGSVGARAGPEEDRECHRRRITPEARSFAVHKVTGAFWPAAERVSRSLVLRRTKSRPAPTAEPEEPLEPALVVLPTLPPVRRASALAGPLTESELIAARDLPRSLRRPRAPRSLAARMRFRPSTEPVLVKKYGNRRLYDTRASRYITQDELEAIIRGGDDVRVIDAKTSEDLTQTTLAQIILEGRRAGRLLPVPLLLQLIRMGDEALAEFMGRYLSATLEMYLEAKRSAQSLSPYLPGATMPFSAANAIARMWLGAGQMIAPEPQYVPPRPAKGEDPPDRVMSDRVSERALPDRAASDKTGIEVAALRRELDELKAALGSSAKRKR
jgi:polyhydroxyalkanoate synthesis repressor PhaR